MFDRLAGALDCNPQTNPGTIESWMERSMYGSCRIQSRIVRSS